MPPSANKSPVVRPSLWTILTQDAPANKLAYAESESDKAAATAKAAAAADAHIFEPFPADDVSFFNKWTYGWVSDIVFKGV